MKKIIGIGIILMLLSICGISGCVDYNHYSEEKSDSGIIKDIECINGDLVVYWNRTDDSYMVFNDVSTWDYVALQYHIGDEVRINCILHYDSEDGTLVNSWLEYVSYEIVDH